MAHFVLYQTNEKTDDDKADDDKADDDKADDDKTDGKTKTHNHYLLSTT